MDRAEARSVRQAGRDSARCILRDACRTAVPGDDADEIGPFWAAVLGADYADDQVSSDPSLWFQETEQHDVPRQRFHWDVWVPVDQARPRLEAALAAGGTLVTDEWAPSFWVVADAQGNKACICTSAARG